MKQTQRAKDYAVITELARLLPADRELELTWDPDRILELAHSAGAGSAREAVVSARISQLDLPDAHARAVDLAQIHLPVRVR